MDTTERQVIDELFGKVKQAEGGSGPRDAQAEARIREHLAAQPAAPYYMAQAIIIQEQALKASQARVEELEADLAQRPAAGGGSFLSGLFGGGAPAKPAPSRPGPAAGIDPRLAAYNTPQQRQGGGFLGGAMQTAMGVAGGLLVGNALMSLFSHEAAAAEPVVMEPAASEPADAPVADDAAYDLPPDDDMDFGGFDEI